MIYTKVMGFLPTFDLKKARLFYEGLLGLLCVSEDEFAIVLDANGTTIRVTKVTDFKPQPFTILGWQVPDIRQAVSELGERGIWFERYGMKGQNEQGIWTAPGGARVAWFKDPDGNVLSLTQFPV
jgi:catechol 2,3-dioxygenase-like lactoylglutathione lyase family enzyme